MNKLLLLLLLLLFLNKIQMVFSLCGIIQIFFLTMSLQGFKVVLDNMEESAWVFFTEPQAKVLKWP